MLRSPQRYLLRLHVDQTQMYRDSMSMLLLPQQPEIYRSGWCSWRTTAAQSRDEPAFIARSNAQCIIPLHP
ncbi:hypothetical protein ID866_8531 [Astraeus odoratus]|nr:hypothetical protein ID866_8531 [Astraeus odoratus]